MVSTFLSLALRCFPKTMTLEPIRRRAFGEPDRSAVQEAMAGAVESDPERFFDQYGGLEQSLGGRYVSADLFKETFGPYSASRHSRHRYNACVHNAAAVLASEYLRRLINSPGDLERDTVILLTGIPGAGKTSSVLAAGDLPTNIRAVYEGQLSNAETALAKVQQVLEGGCKRSSSRCTPGLSRRSRTRCGASRSSAAVRASA
jgi:hypothetical protein